MTFRPTGLVAEEGREFRWRGRLVVPGLFDGEHYFRIDPLGPERTALTHGEDFSGLLAGTLLARIREPVREAFASMNRALKERIEKAPE